MKYQKFFESILIGGTHIKNRIVMAPINNFRQFDPTDGSITQRCIEYYLERAKGGVGLIITGVIKVENEVEHYVKDDMVLWPLMTPKALPKYAELVDYVHSYGTKIFAQLSAGVGRVAKGEVIDSGMRPVSASPNRAFWRPDITCRALTAEEVAEIVKAFGRAAEIVANAGLDGIEIHGHEGYLIDQFTTSLWNKRKDKYGGNLLGRLRLPIEVLQTIKERVGYNFPVIYRYGIKHFIKAPWRASLGREGDIEVGRDVAEALAMARLLEKEGYDALDIDTGCYDSMYWAHPPIYQTYGCALDLIAKAKKVVKIPVIAVNRLGVPELAERVLVEGKADMIALGRPLLADPYWASKVKHGRTEDIRPCIGCHEGCIVMATTGGRPLGCSVNPTCGREKFYALTPTPKSKRVLVVGGGVAGMEAARVAATRGHKVVLYEKTASLGGHLIEASVPDFKEDIRRLLNWYKTQLDKLKIDVKLKTKVTPELLRHERFDVLIVATGSTQSIPKIPGIEKPFVVTCCDLLLGKKKAGNQVVVVGGGLEGCETALWLAKQGKTVTVLEILSEVATDMHSANRSMLLDLLDENKVQIMTDTSCQEVTESGVLIDGRSQRKEIDCDTVVLATGLSPDQEIYEFLVGETVELYLIGDCKEPRKIHHAIWEGYTIGYTV